jgi:gliding motility-associated lipoprotein GldJ
LIREGILEGYNVEATGPTTFNTEAYLSGQHEGGASVPDLNPSNTEGTRKVRMEDGFLLPRYRLPTEAEWEFASYGLIGNIDNGQENYTDRKIYPWNGHWVRNDGEEFRGMIRANFARGKGDFMGISGNLNDGHDATGPVDEYWPNDFGLYNMAGNVAEWTSSLYYEGAYNFQHDMNPDIRMNAKDNDPPRMKRKVVRGGSWKDVGFFLQNSSRTYEYQDTTKSYVGFRCVIDLPPTRLKK